MRRTCTICKRTFVVEASLETLPFCSSRCKMVDLGSWLQGSYRIPLQNEAYFSEEIPESALDNDLDEELKN